MMCEFFGLQNYTIIAKMPAYKMLKRQNNVWGFFFFITFASTSKKLKTTVYEKSSENDGMCGIGDAVGMRGSCIVQERQGAHEQ
jgi:hypothetical protein